MKCSGDTLVSDYQLRKYLKKTLQAAGVPKIEIERDSARVRIFIHCCKAGDRNRPRRLGNREAERGVREDRKEAGFCQCGGG